ncbi:MAG: hypothetical protein A2499_06185 [Stygiobacter sp. RIFOXYC12_FULL_38_8]|nr:MAG: hypothetical protein A2X62_03995 [Stygiobacter sp. GWC2_38_9]OGV07176.1 MAG: hypothetical protein A2299_04815 [Stygiobacter sp. RIFOXYB2_FULL_37_11]OGV10387.1 MAG: hypothetical protein A2237_07550 [Stygiobacter sp. RIFOXYA2_FULL_38_8]OGV14598.1 MAG: hypothetical protein A2440_09195 [Stygiobacter sp. RIFOXYC2_FULL_38_25]OGV29304.1 MAG: hypothetical protein A2499_06185 [Stygiobacter sp. RIFOXYC12_FULL_38_8]OGV81477.1 MAG: hypothetical protein A2X65_10970 [Stygiobacter sp. GWF2_38_21]RJQ
MTINEIEKAADNLTPAEKALLSYKLLESIDSESSENLDQFWQKEIDDRYNQILKGKAILKNANSVINEAKQKYE